MSDSTAKGSDLIGQTIDRGRYEVLKVIGEGGMGRVFEAKQVSMDRLVAIKVLHGHWAKDPKLLERFKREALTASQFRHPNTVMVYDYGETERGEFYIIMELLQGQSLLSLVEREGPLTLQRALSIMEQVCGALSEVHRCGVIHRDLKPENIQIDPRDGHPDFVKLLDFSIAKIVNDNTLAEASQKALTLQGAVFGTPQYMSPEQVRGKKLDKRTDIYALGVIFYQLLTGHVPFAAETPQGTMMAHLTDPIPNATELFPELNIHPEATRLVSDCLVKDPEKRLPSSEALLARIKELTIKLELEHTEAPSSSEAQHTDVDIAAIEEASALDSTLSAASPSSPPNVVTKETSAFELEEPQKNNDSPQAGEVKHQAPDQKEQKQEQDQEPSQKETEAHLERASHSSSPSSTGEHVSPSSTEPEQAEESSASFEPPPPALTIRGGLAELSEELEAEGLKAIVRAAQAKEKAEGKADSIKPSLTPAQGGSRDDLNPSANAPVSLDRKASSGLNHDELPTGMHEVLEAPKGGRSWVWALLLLLLGGGGAGAAWWSAQPTKEQPSPPKQRINLGKQPISYRVEANTTCEVYLLKEGTEERLGQTPYELKLSPSQTASLMLRADGYQQKLTSVSYQTSHKTDTPSLRSVQVTLEPLPSAPPTPSAPSKTKEPTQGEATPPPKTPSSSAKTSRKVKARKGRKDRKSRKARKSRKSRDQRTSKQKLLKKNKKSSSSQKKGKTEPKKTEPKKTEPKKTEPKKTEPKKTEPKKTEPQTKPDTPPPAELAPEPQTEPQPKPTSKPKRVIRTVPELRPLNDDADSK